MGNLTPEILNAIDSLAAAVIAGNPELKSSDKAYNLCLHEFRLRFLAQRSALAAAAKPAATSEPTIPAETSPPSTEQVPLLQG